MTTTHTFQGLNTDGKPSSRVLNPPGGSSSNIFGGYDDQPPQRTPIRNNPDNVNRSNSDVFGPGHNAAASSQQKSRAPRSAFNPITGEAYDQPTSKQAPPTSVSRTSENNSIKTDTASSESSDTSRSQSSEQQKPQPVEEEKPVPVEHETPPPTEQETPKPIEQENPKSVEQEQSKPVEQEKVEPTPITVNAQAAQNKKQQEGGHFGGPDDAKEQHRSTRVSQPPGGRSTNLW